MYDPKIGKWLSQDPLGFSAGDSNMYRYVGNTPTNVTDPTGLRPNWLGTAQHEQYLATWGNLRGADTRNLEDDPFPFRGGMGAVWVDQVGVREGGNLTPQYIRINFKTYGRMSSDGHQTSAPSVRDCHWIQIVTWHLYRDRDGTQLDDTGYYSTGLHGGGRAYFYYGQPHVDSTVSNPGVVGRDETYYDAGTVPGYSEREDTYLSILDHPDAARDEAHPRQEAVFQDFLVWRGTILYYLQWRTIFVWDEAGHYHRTYQVDFGKSPRDWRDVPRYVDSSVLPGGYASVNPDGTLSDRARYVNPIDEVGAPPR